MPVVSVIIPNYNHASYLQQRIDSVLEQTYQDYEVIILDDRSPDNSREIIERYKGHPKITHIVFNEVNSGNTFKQWVKGIGLAKGKYIWIAESDDYAEPGFLETLVPLLDQDPGVDIAFCDSLWVDKNGQVVKDINRLYSFTGMPGKEFIAQFMLSGNAIYNASMAIFRKEGYNRINNTNYLDYKYCGDWLFWALLLLDSKVSYTDQKLNNFRRHGSSVSSKFDKEKLFLLEALKIQLYIKSLFNPGQKNIRKASANGVRAMLRRMIFSWPVFALLIKFDNSILFRFPFIIFAFYFRQTGSKVKRRLLHIK